MQEGSTKKPYVVLLHGIGRDSRMMAALEDYLKQRQEYLVYNDTYPCTQHPLEELVDIYIDYIKKTFTEHDRPLHFVGHSMGGILIRLMLTKYRPPNFRRLIMIAPPNHGSEVVDFMKPFWFYKNRFGPAGQQIGTDPGSVPKNLPPVDYEVGVIAGSATSDRLFSWFLLPGPGDGKVTIESTKCEGMRDHIVLPASHPCLPSYPGTFKQVDYFLKHGCFDHQKLV